MAEAPSARLSASLRLRITAAATAVVGLALVAGAVVFLVLLRGALIADVRASLDGDIDGLEVRVDELVPVTATDDDLFFQVLAPDGTVEAASDSAPYAPLDLEVSDQGQRVSIPGESDDYLVVASATGDGRTLIAGRTLEDIGETLGTVGTMLGWAVPALIVLAAASSWAVVGRALAPVEQMRREVEEVTAANLHRRVADPGREDELGRLAGTLNGMLERLEAYQHAQRRFISDASHELKSPLAALRQNAEVARSYPERLSGAELSTVVLEEGRRLERLVQAMLTLTRADEQYLAFSGHEVDLDDVVLREAGRVHHLSGVRVDTSRVGPARILGNEDLLGQLVRNLGENAVRHAAGQVVFSLEADDGSVRLAVDDDGTGVPSHERDRIFERFTRLDEARARDAGGSGLGLAIVRELVRAHGGSVQVTDSPLLAGARFQVRLPVAS